MLCGIAVPLLDRHGDLVGGLNVSMPMGNKNSEYAVARVLPVLQETARAMRNWFDGWVGRDAGPITILFIANYA